MEMNALLELIRELAVLLIVFTGALTAVLFLGRQFLVNFIIGLYLALLFTTIAPFAMGASLLSAVLIFTITTIGTTLVIARLLPLPYREKRLESFGKKLLLSAGVTVLILTFSFHVLPMQELLAIGSPISYIFGRDDLFFWWLIAPFVLLYFHK